MDEVFDLIKKLEDEKNYEEALRHLEYAYEEKLGPSDIRKDIGRVCNKMRNFNDALSNFEIVLTMDESNPEYLFGKGISLIGLNKFDDALEVFDKLTEVDKDNANGWYYKALLSKSLGDTDAKKYFNIFLKLDDEEFRSIRSYYKFGIQFDEYEHEFREFYRLDILSELKEELSSLNSDQYTELVRLVPLENLFDRIIEEKGLKVEYDVNDIIRQEFKKQGLTDDDVDDLFKIETTENLKKEVIELSGEDPFNVENHSDFVPLKVASKYNPKSNLIRKHEDLRLFCSGNFYLDNGNLEEAIKIYDDGLKINPDNLLLKFVKCCAVYKLGDINVK